MIRLFTIGVVAIFAGSALAGTFEWTGNDGFWTDPANWTLQSGVDDGLNGFPDATDIAEIPQPSVGDGQVHDIDFNAGTITVAEVDFTASSRQNNLNNGTLQTGFLNNSGNAGGASTPDINVDLAQGVFPEVRLDGPLNINGDVATTNLTVEAGDITFARRTGLADSSMAGFLNLDGGTATGTNGSGDGNPFGIADIHFGGGNLNLTTSSTGDVAYDNDVMVNSSATITANNRTSSSINNADLEFGQLTLTDGVNDPCIERTLHHGGYVHKRRGTRICGEFGPAAIVAREWRVRFRRCFADDGAGRSCRGQAGQRWWVLG